MDRRATGISPRSRRRDLRPYRFRLTCCRIRLVTLTETRGEAQETIELLGGYQATLRFIEPSDAEALVRFHTGLSPASIQLRFFNLHLTLATPEVQRFVNVDGTDRVALVIEIGSDIVAVGRFDRMQDDVIAEVAFVVADEYQHHGLGSLLLRKLAALAQERRITTFYAQTLEGNRAMLGVFRESGFPMTTSHSWGVVDVTLDIANSESTS